MSNVIPHNAKISSDLEIQTVGDFHLINTLLEKNPRYNIPKHLREKVVRSCERILDYPNNAGDAKIDKLQLLANKVLLECDKRNTDIVKMAIPKQVIHREAKDLTDEELTAEVIKLIKNNPELKQKVDIASSADILDAQSAGV